MIHLNILSILMIKERVELQLLSDKAKVTNPDEPLPFASK